MLEGIKRVYHHFKDPASIEKIEDSKKLQSDLKVTKTVKDVFLFLAAVSAGCLIYSLVFYAVIPGILSATALIASLLAIKRLNTVIVQLSLRIESIKKKLDEETKAEEKAKAEDAVASKGLKRSKSSNDLGSPEIVIETEGTPSDEKRKEEENRRAQKAADFQAKRAQGKNASSQPDKLEEAKKRVEDKRAELERLKKEAAVLDQQAPGSLSQSRVKRMATAHRQRGSMPESVRKELPNDLPEAPTGERAKRLERVKTELENKHLGKEETVEDFAEVYAKNSASDDTFETFYKVAKKYHDDIEELAKLQELVLPNEFLLKCLEMANSKDVTHNEVIYVILFLFAKTDVILSDMKRFESEAHRYADKSIKSHTKLEDIEKRGLFEFFEREGNFGSYALKVKELRKQAELNAQQPVQPSHPVVFNAFLNLMNNFKYREEKWSGDGKGVLSTQALTLWILKDKALNYDQFKQLITLVNQDELANANANRKTEGGFMIEIYRCFKDRPAILSQFLEDENALDLQHFLLTWVLNSNSLETAFFNDTYFEWREVVENGGEPSLFINRYLCRYVSDQMKPNNFDEFRALISFSIYNDYLNKSPKISRRLPLNHPRLSQLMAHIHRVPHVIRTDRIFDLYDALIEQSKKDNLHFAVFYDLVVNFAGTGTKELHETDPLKPFENLILKYFDEDKYLQGKVASIPDKNNPVRYYLERTHKRSLHQGLAVSTAKERRKSAPAPGYAADAEKLKSTRANLRRAETTKPADPAKKE